MPTSVAVAIRVDSVSLAGAAGPPPFTPNSLPSPIFWFDFGDPATLFADTAGTIPAGDLVAVARANDKTVNARNISQAVGTQRPTRDASFTPSVVFCDGGDRLFSAAFTAIPQPFAICVVSDNLANNSCFYDNGTAGTRILAQRGAANNAVSIFAGVSLAATGLALPVDVRRAWLFEYNGASSKIWQFDGTNFVQVGATGNAGANTLADLRIFGNTAAFLTSAETCELFAFGAVPTAQNRADIGAYVDARWSL